MQKAGKGSGEELVEKTERVYRMFPLVATCVNHSAMQPAGFHESLLVFRSRDHPAAKTALICGVLAAGLVEGITTAAGGLDWCDGLSPPSLRAGSSRVTSLLSGEDFCWSSRNSGRHFVRILRVETFSSSAKVGLD